MERENMIAESRQKYILKLNRDGLSVRKISLVSGVSRTAVRSIIKRGRVIKPIDTPPRPFLSPDECTHLAIELVGDELRRYKKLRRWIERQIHVCGYNRRDWPAYPL
jgi:hypothetical protein